MNALPALTDGLKLSFLFLPKEHDPDSYVREFGKEKFEAEIKSAMPLSQYILQHLSENNALQSQEDRVRFLNEAEPIMQQINAPRSAMYLRKKVAELALLSPEEMQEICTANNMLLLRSDGFIRLDRMLAATTSTGAAWVRTKPSASVSA